MGGVARLVVAGTGSGVGKPTLASHVHLHFGSTPALARNLVASCAARG